MKISSLFTGSGSDGKFGAFQGVLVPNVLMMIGVILFMRVGWVLGNVGIGQTVAIMFLSLLLLLATGLSLTAIVSNMKIRAGGAYYLISRTLGIEFGSAIGMMIFISQLASIALCVTGFSLSVQEFFPDASLTLIKASTLSFLLLIAYFSTNFALKTQILIFLLLAVSVCSIFFGSQAPSDTLHSMEGPTSVGFWVAFSIFFPAMTGIECGMSMSGDLRNPSRSLPIGTLGAVGIVFTIYLSLALFLSSFVPADLLVSYPFILYHISKAGYLVIMGIWAATLSSALGALLGGPRIMQAIARDGILPPFLAKGYGPTNQPRMATLVVFCLGMALTLGTDINQIIPMLTMVCLVSYGLINFIAFFESFIQNPSWRPSFRIPFLIPLFGAIGCFMAMFMINPGATFIAFAFCAFLCVWTAKRKVQGNWDDLRHSIFSYLVHKGTIKLSQLEKSAKSWRPHILTIFDRPLVNKNLAYFSQAINQERGFLTFAASVESQEIEESSYRSLKEDLNGFKIPSHLHVNLCPKPAFGAEQIIQNYGFGLLRPNTVILSASQTFEIDELIRLLIDTHRQEKNVILLKDDAQKDYLYSDPSRKAKQINLWWRGKHPGNFELCLALAYLLQQSKLWPRSKICIKMIVKDEEHKEKLVEQFVKYKVKLRIKDLSFAPIVDPKMEFFSSLLAHSADADLTFLGLRRPQEQGSPEEYKEYYTRLLENTAELNNVAYVLCGEKVKFRKIFL